MIKGENRVLVLINLKSRFLSAFPDISLEEFDESWAILGLIRHTKNLAHFSRLYVQDGKTRYLHHIPRIWRHTERCLSHPVLSSVRAWMLNHIPQSQREAPLCPLL